MTFVGHWIVGPCPPVAGTTRTVKAHRHNVMVKMQVKSLAELVSIAERIGVASGTGHMD